MDGGWGYGGKALTAYRSDYHEDGLDAGGVTGGACGESVN